ncbi:MAG: zinc ribbon domain-containing protein [Eubacterium sp.]
MKCRKCGKEIEDNIKFCPYCGEVIQMKSDINGNKISTGENQNTDDSTEKISNKSAPLKEAGTPGKSIADSASSHVQGLGSEVQGKPCEMTDENDKSEKSKKNGSISDAVGRVCVKCGFLTYDKNLNSCPKCGGQFVSTGYTAKDWKGLSTDEKLNLMHKLVPALFNGNQDKEKVILNKDARVEKRHWDEKAAMHEIADRKEIAIQNHMYEQKITRLEKKVEGLEKKSKALTIVLIIAVVIGFLSVVIIGGNIHRIDNSISSLEYYIDEDY